MVHFPHAEPYLAAILIYFAGFVRCRYRRGFPRVGNFEAYAPGTFPSKWRRRSDEGLKIYRVESENGNRFRRAYADKQAVQIGLEYVFDPNEQRRLTWRWRVRQLPLGSDERNPEKHNAAAQAYIIFDNQYWPRIIKYMWSATLPVNLRFTNPLYGRGRVIVQRSGLTEKAKWHEEEVNFYQDY